MVNTIEAVDQLFPFCQKLEHLGILPHVYTNARWPFPGGLWEEILQVNSQRTRHGLGGITHEHAINLAKIPNVFKLNS